MRCGAETPPVCLAPVWAVRLLAATSDPGCRLPALAAGDEGQVLYSREVPWLLFLPGRYSR